MQEEPDVVEQSNKVDQGVNELHVLSVVMAALCGVVLMANAHRERYRTQEDPVPLPLLIRFPPCRHQWSGSFASLGYLTRLRASPRVASVVPFACSRTAER